MYDGYLLEGVSFVDIQDGGSSVNMSADKIASRKRQTAHGFVTYENLREIHAAGVKIDVHLGHGDTISTVLAQALMTLASLGHASSPEDIDSTQTDTDAHVLTRIRFADLMVTILFPDEKPLSLETKAARLNFMPRAFVFLEPLTLTLDEDRTVKARTAVWSEEHGGIYFPKGYELNGVSGPRNAVLIVSSRGAFLSEAPRMLPNITLADMIDEREKALVSLFLDRLPKGLLPVVRMLLPR